MLRDLNTNEMNMVSGGEQIPSGLLNPTIHGPGGDFNNPLQGWDPLQVSSVIHTGTLDNLATIYFLADGSIFADVDSDGTVDGRAIEDDSALLSDSYWVDTNGDNIYETSGGTNYFFSPN